MRYIFFLLWFFSLYSEERISLFSSTANIDEFGTLFIHEKIQVICEEKLFKHGFYRRFNQNFLGYNFFYKPLDNLPTIYSVKCNGKKVFYRSRYNAIYIGDPNVQLPAGTYTYEISYSISGTIKYYTDHDRFYWHVTGQHWNLPIDKIEASLSIHKNNFLSFKRAKAFIQNSCWHITEQLTYRIENNYLKFSTNSALDDGKDLVIDIDFNKGLFNTKSFEFENVINNPEFQKIFYILIIFILFYLLKLIFNKDKKHKKANLNLGLRPHKRLLLYEYILLIVFILFIVLIAKLYQLLTLSDLYLALFFLFLILIYYIRRFIIFALFIIFSIHSVYYKLSNIFFVVPMCYIVYKLLNYNFFYIRWSRYRGGGGGGAW